MAYRSATKLTFTPRYADLSEEQRMAEQVAAYEIVGKYQGEFEAQFVLYTDQVFLAVVKYPDEESAMKAQMAIQARGAYELHSQRALTLEELLQLQAEAGAASG
jgi:uncharacterized protein with GYD domain